MGILDKEGNKMHLSDNLVIELLVDGKFLQVTSSLTNGALHTGVPLIPGHSKLSAILVGDPGRHVLGPPAKCLAMGPCHSLPVHCQAYTNTGDSPLTWSSTNTTISTTSQLGISSVSGSLLGSSTVTVAMTRASHCQASQTCKSSQLLS